MELAQLRRASTVLWRRRPRWVKTLVALLATLCISSFWFHPAPYNYQWPSLSWAAAACGGRQTADPIALKPPLAFAPEKDKVVFFYNAFLPRRNPNTGIEILAESMAAKANSVYARHPVRLFTMGANVPVRCPHCQFEFHSHHDVWDERHTHEAMQKYCREHPSHRVSYMHNKGSLHPSALNDNMRQLLTKSVLSPECYDMPEQCNVCTARFSPLPTFHGSGNYFVARCDYVVRLLPALEFSEAMLTVVATSPFFRPFRHKPGEDRQSYFKDSLSGTGRWAAESWLHSHPSVFPCDVYNGEWVWDYPGIPEYEDWVPVLRMAPRFDLNMYWHFLNRSEPRFSFGSTLFKWQILYAQVPPAHSWVWQVYDVAYCPGLVQIPRAQWPSNAEQCETFVQTFRSCYA